MLSKSIQEKGMTMAAGLLVLTEFVGGILKEDTAFYKNKNKQLLNSLMLNNASLLIKYKNIRDLMFVDPAAEKIYKESYKNTTGVDLEYDPNVILEDMSFVNNIFRLFIKNYIVADEATFINLYVTLKNMLDKELVISGRDVEVFAKSFAKKFVNYEVKEEEIKSFIKNYGKTN